MAKQLTILFWCLLYGEVLGYIVSALNASPFNPITSGIVPMVIGWILVNAVSLFMKPTDTKEDNKK